MVYWLRKKILYFISFSLMHGVNAQTIISLHDMHDDLGFPLKISFDETYTISATKAHISAYLNQEMIKYVADKPKLAPAPPIFPAQIWLSHAHRWITHPDAMPLRNLFFDAPQPVFLSAQAALRQHNISEKRISSILFRLKMSKRSKYSYHQAWLNQILDNLDELDGTSRKLRPEA